MSADDQTLNIENNETKGATFSFIILKNIDVKSLKYEELGRQNTKTISNSSVQSAKDI